MGVLLHLVFLLAPVLGIGGNDTGGCEAQTGQQLHRHVGTLHRRGRHPHTWSKADQLNAGCIRSQSKAGGPLCPIQSLRTLFKCSPWLLDPGYTGPLFSGDGVRKIPRLRVQCMLRIEEGLPVERVGTHSLRIGGASALYNLGWTFGHIQRFGRWRSEAFHGCLRDTFGLHKGASRSMANIKLDLHAGVLTAPGIPDLWGRW